MAFKFSLATVLRVRSIREEREERMLQQILFEISQTLRLIEQLDAELEQLNIGRLNSVFASVQGRDIHDAYGRLMGLAQNRKELEAHIEKLEQLKDMQIKAYETARRDREMLTDMRRDQRDEYWLEVAKREQKTLDDTFGARRSRLT